MSESSLTDGQFRALLNLMMVSDPWPLSDEEHDRIDWLLDCEAQARGFDRWTEAYHEFDGEIEG